MNLNLNCLNQTTIRDYDIQCLIGQGAFGVVQRATTKANGQKVAIKQYDRSKLLQDANRVVALNKESAILAKLNHEGIMGFVDSIDSGNKINIVVEYINGNNPPSSTGYETYLLRLIVMASVALDNLFVRKLRSALEALGDPTKTVVADREVRIYGRDGALLLTITRAPVKSRARMLNKLESAEDHRDKEVPRPKANVDTVRAGIVVEDAGMMAAVLEAVGAHVGRFLRSKNAFREDAEVSYGYRAFLGNLQLESGLTVGDVFGGEQRAKWQALAEAGRAADAAEPNEVKELLDALLAEDPLARVACETFATTNRVVIGGEIGLSDQAKLSEYMQAIPDIARACIRDIDGVMLRGYCFPAVQAALKTTHHLPRTLGFLAPGEVHAVVPVTPGGYVQVARHHQAGATWVRRSDTYNPRVRLPKSLLPRRRTGAGGLEAIASAALGDLCHAV